MAQVKSEKVCRMTVIRTVTSRFIVAGFNGSSILMISDYIYWMDNEREILNWMVDNLPNGIDHQEGMVLTFDNEQDRLMFLLRWG